ncbi:MULTISPECIES: replicative DNA helicase [Persicobacter]|uniref:Replicative DNA helicase n=1 Tax=Persicobacter diffluens TaxID=981 RepID=A0AAN4VYK4_9BACT|nr:replicative DNA helicase [Persicobacter sp. CCB-QB2]GJM61441.1 replicative DNA helicase [Persicobacter diffluens]
MMSEEKELGAGAFRLPVTGKEGVAKLPTKTKLPTTLATGKIPPQANELEEVVLGALMLEKDALTNVIDILRPESFYKEGHKLVYKAIRDLFNDAEPVDLMTVTNRLRKNGDLEKAGGPLYLSKLTSKTSNAANVEFHARIISEQAIKRELIQVASKIQTEAYDDTRDVFELLDDTERSLFEVTNSNIRKSVSDMRSVMGQAIAELEAKKTMKDGLTGVPSGLTQLDRVTAGWQPSDLVIIAARPAMGKTAFVLTVLRNAAVDFDKPAAIFSLEMSNVQLVNRLISAEAELESEKLKKGMLQDFEWEQLVERTNRLTNAPIFIDDTPALSILELRAKCRRLKAQHDIQIIIIDYLQLMSGDSKSVAGGNREQEISSISRALKGLAKELNVPVIALSQLSRAVETRGGDKRPQLSDLRESGAIEQDADMVMFLYRPEYYGITQDEAGNPTAGTGEVIIAKHRNGALDTVPLRFIGKYTKFEDLDLGGFQNFSRIPDGSASFDPESNGMIIQSKANEGLGEPPTNMGVPPESDGPAPF